MIREAYLEDLDAIMEIFNYSILHTTTVYSYDPYTHEMMEEWFVKKQQENLPIIVAVQENKVIGYATYGSFRYRPAYQTTIEHSVYVHNDYQRIGVGKKLLLSLIELAKEKDYHTMIGGVDASNEESVLFHQKMGFKEVGHLPEVAYKFDRWLDLKLMQLILSEK